MHQENSRYYQLADKWLKGTITEEEMNELSKWYDNTEDEIFNIPHDFARSEEELRKRILLRIDKRRRQPGRLAYLTRATLVKLAVASAVLVTSILSLLYITREYSSADEKNVIVEVTKHDSIMPGGNKAILVLSDGTKVILDTATNGTIVDNHNTKVIKLDGELTYTGLVDVDAPVSFNTLTTPRGGQYAITLVDGTRVWLNSSSSLHFPTSFRDPERIVELSGEAYFEVAHNRDKPFKVKVNDVYVKVLGTHFNVMAYKEETTINATLLEGAISISKMKETILLNPGQQAQIRPNGSIGIIKNADAEQVIAWKNGFFNFNGSDIETTMRQIARWYDIEVIYEDKITEHFNGTIVRNASIQNVLRMLELTGVVHFTQQGRRIFVR